MFRVTFSSMHHLKNTIGWGWRGLSSGPRTPFLVTPGLRCLWHLLPLHLPTTTPWPPVHLPLWGFWPPGAPRHPLTLKTAAVCQLNTLTDAVGQPGHGPQRPEKTSFYHLFSPIQLGKLPTMAKRAKIRWANIGLEWAESCPNRGITAGCCQNGCGGLFVKHLEMKCIELGSSTRTRFNLTIYMQFFIFTFLPLIHWCKHKQKIVS